MIKSVKNFGDTIQNIYDKMDSNISNEISTFILSIQLHFSALENKIAELEKEIKELKNNDTK